MSEKHTPDQPIVKGADVIYRPAGNAGEYAPLATNPYRGCGHGCKYCVAPETLIQMADGTAKPIQDVLIGDDLIGVSRRAEVRRAWNYSFSRSTVMNKIETVKQAYRIGLDDGKFVVCSADHRWLTERGWKFTDKLTLNNEIRVLSDAVGTTEVTDDYRLGYLSGVIRGDGLLRSYDYSGRYKRRGRATAQRTDVLYQFRLAMDDMEAIARTSAFLARFGVTATQFVFKHNGRTSPAIRTSSRAAFDAIQTLTMPRAGAEWMRGWLAGIFDAEGGTTSALRIHNTDDKILAMTDVAMGEFGFRTVRDKTQPNGCAAVRLVGGLPEIVRFFNVVAPSIERKFPVEGSALKGSSRIVDIEPLGKKMEMIDITTSTENFVANGMIAHNCYVPLATHIDRAEFNKPAKLRPGYLERLVKDCERHRAAGLDDVQRQIFITFSSDPWHPGDHSATRSVIELLIGYDLAFCTLTKSGVTAIANGDIRLFRPKHDAFAATLTSLDDAFSYKWEPDAARPQERIGGLKCAHEMGIFTWVSIEPTLDVEHSLKVIEATAPFVDLFKIGKANYLKEITRTTDWEDYTWRVCDLLQKLGKKHYIKRDLQPHLPVGYENPLRIPQHH